MWRIGWRDEVWSALDQKFDLIVIGGGITGAGIFAEACRKGFKTLLVEARDFASGTSSRSSKLVHGGFRYLRNGQIKITYDSVRERERLLREERGLIHELGFLIARYEGDRIPIWALGLGLTLYDLIAFRWGHKYYQPERMLDLCPQLNPQDLEGGYRYFDALTDDSRLVLKIIKNGIEFGGLALNYCPVQQILHTRHGQATGIVFKDITPDGLERTFEVQSTAVINATGVWADEIFNLAHGKMIGKPKLRKLQGSHLVFSQDKLPLTRAVSIWHPEDKRPVFAFPWEGVTLVGTTDVDFNSRIKTDPQITGAEFEYLLDFIHFAFPGLNLTSKDVQSTFSGYRAVLDTGKRDPSKESREHILEYDSGLLTVAGGKLTTFRLMANQALRLIGKKVASFSPSNQLHEPGKSPSIKLFARSAIDTTIGIRLIGRLGKDVDYLVDEIPVEEFRLIDNSRTTFAELRWGAKAEGVVHLDDLLLRRVRLGITLPGGGLSIIQRIKEIVTEELYWDEPRWQEELTKYKQLLSDRYSVRF